MTSGPAIILGVFVVLAAGTLAAISRHKKSGPGHIRLVGSTGLVYTELNPHGTVLIQGELWRACSNDGTGLAPGSKVKVVGTLDHLLLVSIQNQ